MYVYSDALMSEFTTELTSLQEDKLHNCDATIENRIDTRKDDSKETDVYEVSRAEVYANQVKDMELFNQCIQILFFIFTSIIKKE